MTQMLIRDAAAGDAEIIGMTVDVYDYLDRAQATR